MAGTPTALLRASLENLPQEIYDIIQTLTFTSICDKVIVDEPWAGRILPKCNPPVPLNLMQVSSATRDHFLTSYYKNTLFVVYRLSVCELWIRTMPEAHRKLLRYVQCFQCELGLSKWDRRWEMGVQTEKARVFGMYCKSIGMKFLQLRSEHIVSLPHHLNGAANFDADS